MGRGERYGLLKPAAQSEYCLPCHSTAFGVPAQIIAPSFDPKAGVQCELCHGPGLAHVEAETIKGSGKSIPAAEVARAFQVAKAAEFKYFEDERAIKARCTSCHDGMCGDFDFSKMWPMIKHAAPKNKN